MLRLSKKLLFAIEAVLDIAYHAGAEPVQSRAITRRQGIPRRYLEQTLQHLVRSDILVGLRGSHGGYRLARERRRISVGEVVRVIRSMETPEDAFGTLPTSDLGRQVIRPMWGDLQEEIMHRLDAITVDDLCMKAYKDGLPSEGWEKLDFNI